MNAYCTYGRMLGNAINNTAEEVPIFPVTAFPWPKKPTLPFELKYEPFPDRS